MTSEIIHKYLSNEASEQEVQALFDWIEASEENKTPQSIAKSRNFGLGSLKFPVIIT